MAVMTRAELAIHGGPKAVTASARDQWRRPVEEEKRLVLQLLERGAYSDSGRGVVRTFEEEFRQLIGAQYCFATDHGHTALACAFYAAGVGPGDEFLTPVIGYIGSYVGALHMGARPVFVDIDPQTLVMDPRDAERKITPRTRAINVTHMFGKLCDMDAFMDLGKRYGLPIVEDACHAHGSYWGDKRIGNVGDVACFSLQGGASPAGKPVAGGEGGLLVTNSRAIWERALIFGQLHRQGLEDELTLPEYRHLDAEVLGWKFRPHPFAAALAKVSLQSLDARRDLAWEHWLRIERALGDLPGLEPARRYPKARPTIIFQGCNVIYHPDQLGGLPASRFVAAMRAEGVPLIGPELRPREPQLESNRALFQRRFDLWGHGRGPIGATAFMGLPPYEPNTPGDFPVAERLSDKVFTVLVPSRPADGYLDQMLEAFHKVTRNAGALL
jgi:dTDP-4-amino-4,6-dideoxygalactose transaminase